MAFPAFSTSIDTDFAASVTSMAVNMPATVNAGDRLIALVHVRNAGTWNTIPTGWSKIAEQAGGGAVGELSIFEKVAIGNEDGTTATWITSASTTGAWKVLRITGAHASTASEVTATSGDATAANPPSETASWGSADNLFIAVAGHSASSAAAWSAAPTNYSNFAINGASSGGSAVCVAFGTRQLANATDDPGTFTVSGSNRWWGAATIVVRPGASNTAPTVALNTPLDGANAVKPSDSSTRPALNFTATDAESDATEHEVQIDIVNTFNTAEAIVSNYENNDAGADVFMSSVNDTGNSQSFRVTDIYSITKASFLLKKNSTPTGNMVAKLYATTGTYGSTSKPTGTALATSNTIDASTLTGSYVWTDFTFPDSQKQHLNIGTNTATTYCITIEFSGTGGTIQAGYDATSPTAGGNRAYQFGGNWTDLSGYDICYRIYGTKTIYAFSDSGVHTAGFTAGHPHASGAAVDYTHQYDLTLGQTYYWRVRSKDPLGTNGYGSWSSTRSFVYTRPLFTSLVDPFTTQIATATWGVYGTTTPVWESGRAKVVGDNNYAGLTTDGLYSLTGNSIYCGLETNGYSDTDGDIGFYLVINSSYSNGYIGFEIGSGGNIMAVYSPSGGPRTEAGSVTYSPITHEFMRIRESGGTTYWEVATRQQAMAGSWQSFHSVANPMAVVNMMVDLYAGLYDTSPDYFAYFDDVNSTPVQLMRGQFLPFF